MKHRLIAVDIEGDGNPSPEIVELALVEFKEDGSIGRLHEWLVNPEREISAYATKIHGITDFMVQDAPTFDDITDDVLRVLEGSTVIGHAVHVDLTILKKKLPLVPWKHAVDTMKLAKKLLPELDKYGLETVVKYLKIKPKLKDQKVGRNRMHTAAYDAVCSGEIFFKLMNSQTNYSQDDLMEIAKSSIEEKARQHEMLF